MILPFLFVSIWIEYLFLTFTFSLCVSLNLKWVSNMQHMHESCSCIHSTFLCILMEVFSTFTFKVIIDRYVLIVIVSLFTFFFCFVSSLSFLWSLLFAVWLFSLILYLGSFVCILHMYFVLLVCDYMEVHKYWPTYI